MQYENKNRIIYPVQHIKKVRKAESENGNLGSWKCLARSHIYYE